MHLASMEASFAYFLKSFQTVYSLKSSMNTELDFIFWVGAYLFSLNTLLGGMVLGCSISFVLTNKRNKSFLLYTEIAIPAWSAGGMGLRA